MMFLLVAKDLCTKALRLLDPLRLVLGKDKRKMT
jgi:hypothetical protein